MCFLDSTISTYTSQATQNVSNNFLNYPLKGACSFVDKLS